jgi:outer membrane receptor protein involved in Fe transport
VIGGTFPQPWLDFVVTPVTGHTAFRESTASVGIDGPLPFFRLPGGDIAVALGAEYRKSSIDDTPSTESQRNNLYGFTSSTATRGSDSVWEVFGEIEFPIIRDSFIKEFTINASGRYTEYKSYGGQETYKLGALLSPVEWLSFRGSYGTSYRAPALFEQFLGSTSGFQSQNNDPCNNYGALPAGSPRAANCASEGLPGNFQATSSIAVLQRGGADTGLSAETSKAYTFGGVFQPKLGSFGNLSVSLDYFHILVENGVSQLGFGTILQQCYDDARFRTTSICDNVTRATTAPFALTVTTGYLNISNSKVAGWDFNLRYTVPIGPGQLRLGAAVTKYQTRYSQTLPTDPIFNTIGRLNNPEWTGTFDANYAFDKWTLHYGVDWVGSTNSDAAFLGITQAVRDTYILETDDLFVHSASIRYQTDRFGLTLGVRNLFDKEPPQVSSGFYNRAANAPLYSGYESLSIFAGRTFFVNATTHF